MQKPTDRWEKKIAPIAVTALVLLYVVPLMVMLVLTVGTGMVYGGGADLLLVLLGYLFLGGAVVAGILKALFQRLREIDGGEEDNASQY